MGVRRFRLVWIWRIILRILVLPVMFITGILYGLIGVISPEGLGRVLKVTGESILGIEPKKRNKIIASDAVKHFDKHNSTKEPVTDEMVEDWYNDFKNQFPEEF